MVMLKLRKPSTFSIPALSIPATMIYYGNNYGAMNMIGLAVAIKDTFSLHAQSHRKAVSCSRWEHFVPETAIGHLIKPAVQVEG